MRHKTNQLLRRIRTMRPEVKKNYRRGEANAAGKFNEKEFLSLNKIFVLAEESAAVE